MDMSPGFKLRFGAGWTTMEERRVRHRRCCNRVHQTKPANWIIYRHDFRRALTRGADAPVFSPGSLQWFRVLTPPFRRHQFDRRGREKIQLQNMQV